MVQALTMTKVIALAVTLIIGVTGVLLVTNGVAWLMPILVKYLFPSTTHISVGLFPVRPMGLRSRGYRY